MEKYRLYITSESGERETWTSGETVKECIDKLKDFHTFGEFEKEFFTKKGEDRLNKELNSGWYVDFKTPSFINELKQTWKPKTKTKTGYGYHGSSKGDKTEYTVYFDEYRCEWTTKDRAFQGLVFKRIDEFLRDI